MDYIFDSTCLSSIESPYAHLLSEGRYKEYLSLLSRDGLLWFFELHFPRITSHLTPLKPFEERTPIPPRVKLLRECIDPAAKLESFEQLYQGLVGQKDFDGACVAAGAAVSWIWNRSCDYRLFEDWQARITQLITTRDVSLHARASLFGWQGIIDIFGKYDLTGAMASFESGLQWAEKARSFPLRLYHSTGIAYVCIHAWDLSKMELYLFDAAPLSDLEETPLICKALFSMVMGIDRLFRKEPSASLQMLEEIESNPYFEMLPLSVRLFIYHLHGFAVTAAGDREQMELLSRKIEALDISTDNLLHHGHRQLIAATASLMLGHPREALDLCGKALEISERCHVPILQQYADLLWGQVLSELNHFDEADKHFRLLMEGWKASHHHLLTIAGLYELVYLLLKQRKKKPAENFYRQILDACAEQHIVSGSIPFFRSFSCYEKIDHEFNPEPLSAVSWPEPESAKIRIELFGSLRVYVDDRLIHDRNWRGNRTKLLLKAVVVHGGTNVPADLLSDILWPDADGDIALGNLKVALNRLKRIGCGNGEKPPAWIETKNKRVSLRKNLCMVDSIRFSQMLSDAEKKRGDETLLRKALDLYTDDFLVDDDDQEWIVRHRLYLRSLYVKGVTALCDHAAANERFDTIRCHLQRAIDKDPLNEGLYLRLMRAFIEKGFPSDAMLVFNRVKTTLKMELGIEPGPEMVGLAETLAVVNKQNT